VKLHSIFKKGTGFSQKCNSERSPFAKLLPNSYSDRYSFAANSGTQAHMYSFQVTVLVGESTLHREPTTLS